MSIFGCKTVSVKDAIREYVGLVESLYLNSMFEWEDAVKWVLTIVVGWGL